MPKPNPPETDEKRRPPARASWQVCQIDMSNRQKLTALAESAIIPETMSGRLHLRFAGTTAGLAVGVTAAVVMACSIAAYFYSTHHFQAQVASARAAALAKGELIRVALEHQMMENDRSLIARMIESFGRQRDVDRVLILDRSGATRFAGGPRAPGDDLSLDSPTCQSCHRLPPESRASSQVIESHGGQVLRTMIPIPNLPACHRCHDPAHRLNGVLLLDHDVGETRAAIAADLRWLVAGNGLLTLLLAGALALVIHFAILRRLRRFETTARLIAAGDLNRRVPAEGSDTLSWLAREFNAMADSVTGLVREVHTQRERLETVINSIDDGIVVLDANRNVLAANDAFLRRVGAAREAVTGFCCRDLAPGSCEVADCPSLSCLRSGQRQIRICERRGPEGAVAWEEVHASPITGASGELVQVVEVWRDISERRAAEARLSESHRLASLGLLASGFSHEMNTPLATVLTCVEGIQRDLPPDGGGAAGWTRVREYAALAREQIMRCRGITQHFLRLSRDQKTPGEIVDLAAVILAVSRLIEPTARAHSVTVEVQPPPSGLHVRANESDLQHTLLNLLLNGIQACRAGGRVTVQAESGPVILLRVSDDGSGIAPENRQRIFEPFFSLREGGTGLGLFLALDFVRRWGGDIRVDSQVGHGSTFEVRLPALAS
jgi:PAS domain S-box-containing protein